MRCINHSHVEMAHAPEKKVNLDINSIRNEQQHNKKLPSGKIRWRAQEQVAPVGWRELVTAGEEGQ